MKLLLGAVVASALLLCCALVLVLLPALTPGEPAASVPAQYAAHVRAAAASCDGVPEAVLSAQLEQESGWDPLAVSPKGALGLAQFMPATWAEHGVDVSGDGRADPHDPVDAIHSAARYDCALKGIVGRLAADPVPLVLAAYNAGPGAVLRAGGVPRIAETQQYVRRILARVQAAVLPAAADGLTPAAVQVRELVRQRFGVTDIGGFARDGHAPGSDHYTGRAVDVMLTPLGPANTALGWRIAQFLQVHAAPLQVTYIIWQGRIWSAGRAREGWRVYRHPQGYTDPTRMHMDHVHVSVR